MASPRNRKHIAVQRPPTHENYTPHPRKIIVPPPPAPTNRRRHASTLRSELLQAERESALERAAAGITVHGAEPGLYVQFESQAENELSLQSLEDRRKGIELVAVQTVGDPPVQRAAVFIPAGKLTHFVKRFREYATEKTKSGQPRHRDVIDRIAAIRRATLRALWTDATESYPAEDELIWWEIWLRRDQGKELERFLDFSEQIGLTVKERRLAFDDRTVVLVKGTAGQLSGSLDVLNDLAEARRAKEGAAFFVDEAPEDQAAWVEDLQRRVTLPSEAAPVVCILDTGVTRGHPLLQNVISTIDAMAVDPTWGSNDDGGGPGNMGHGTEMAGLAAYGDLARVLESSAPVQLRHRLETVKILPPTGANEPDLYGAITAQAVARPEVNAPHRIRVFSLAVTAIDNRDRGQPTSWSAAIDALAAGRTFDPTTQGLVYLDEAEQNAQRLLVVSAGNVHPNDLHVAHLDRSDIEVVHDPAQAWNALTVGAFTEKAVINDPDWNGWTPVARPGDLSPWSTTSLLFRDSWPIKPDVVFEGGNIAHDGSVLDFPVPDLCLLSTHYKPSEKLLVLSSATSAATAQVARLAILVRSEYPEFWPETVRALLVHSARWTAVMQAHLAAAGGRRDRGKLVRRYGYGVPSVERALRSADDALTLVSQSSIRPFSEGKMNEMHIHELPWPRDVLHSLEQRIVRLRVTLSYFIEPNPSRLGGKKRHRYASHGLRFDVKSPTESIAEFRKRLNKRALEEDEDRPRTGDSEGWFLGEQTRTKGSIHSDVWEGTAADLADRGVIGVYPVSGWWKDQPKRDRGALGARYSVVVSIETEEEGIDFWTPVAQEVGVPLETAVIEI